MKDKLKYLSKNKEERLQQVSLIINNCKIHGIKVKQYLIDEYNKLTKK